MKLTPTQSKIYSVIRQSIVVRGVAPTLREIGAAVGLSSSATIHWHIERLSKKGLVIRDKKRLCLTQVVTLEACLQILCEWMEVAGDRPDCLELVSRTRVVLNQALPRSGNARRKVECFPAPP